MTEEMIYESIVNRNVSNNKAINKSAKSSRWKCKAIFCDESTRQPILMVFQPILNVLQFTTNETNQIFVLINVIFRSLSHAKCLIYLILSPRNNGTVIMPMLCLPIARQTSRHRFPRIMHSSYCAAAISAADKTIHQLGSSSAPLGDS